MQFMWLIIFHFVSSDRKMARNDTEDMMKKSDCKLPPPEAYPGVLHHNNVSGTLLSRGDWVKFECRKWIEEMKHSVKYDASYFSVKVHCLKGWLVKTFHNVSVKVVKDILYELENKLEDEKGIIFEEDESDSESNADSEIDHELIDNDMDYGQESPDLFASDSDQMEEDAPLTRKGKISTINWYLDKFDQNMLDNEDSVPEFVRK
jgi:hypothetical protein